MGSELSADCPYTTSHESSGIHIRMCVLSPLTRVPCVRPIHHHASHPSHIPVIPSRGDERSEMPPCRGILAFPRRPILSRNCSGSGGIPHCLDGFAIVSQDSEQQLCSIREKHLVMKIGTMFSGRYYGWTITWALALTETVSFGILYYAFSALLVPMQSELGWSATAITGAFSLCALVAGLAAPMVGRWVDHHGPRALMTAGSIAGTVLVIAWSQVETLVGFYLIWIGIGLASAAVFYDPAFTTLTQWFVRNRARAMLIVTVVAGFASTIFLPLTGWLVHLHGWRNALIVLAVILAITTIPPHALLLRRKPEDLGLAPDGDRLHTDKDGLSSGPEPMFVEPGEATHSAGFRWMTAAFFLQTLASIAIGVHLIAYLTERGDGATFAATVTGLIGAAQVAARIVTTVLDRRLSMVILTSIVFALQALALVILVVWQQPAGVIITVILLGMGRGAVTLIRPGLLADLYGRKHFGAINGIQSLVISSARAIAPVATGVAYVMAGGYTPVIWVLAGISLLSAIAMLRVPGAARVTAVA